MKKAAPLIVVSGPSGSGKTTLCRMIAERLQFYYGVSHTTRPKRGSEMHGVDYYFVSGEEFKNMVDASAFLEWAEVYGRFYGTSRRVVEEHLAQGQGVILDVDTQGALAIKKAKPQATLVFLSVPSMQKLEERLVNRGTDSPESRLMRLTQARKEEESKIHYDHVLVNEDLDETYRQLEAITKASPSTT